MAWTTMRDRETGDLFEEIDYDAFKDNIDYLLSTIARGVYGPISTTVSTTSTSYTSVSGATHTITIAGTRVLVLWNAGFGYQYHLAGTALFAIQHESDTEIEVVAQNANNTSHGLAANLFTGLTPGEHTFRGRFKSGSGSYSALVVGGTTGAYWNFLALEV